MMKNILFKITLILLVLHISIVVSAQKELMYINVSPDSRGDSMLIEYLGQKGFNVTFVSSNDFSSDAKYKDAAAYADYDALFIGEALSANQLYNFHLAGYPIPCVTTEGWAFRDPGSIKWSWLSDNENQFHQLSNFDAATAEQANNLIFTGDTTTWLGLQYLEGQEILWCNKVAPAVGSNGINFEDVDSAIALANIPVDALEGLPVMWAFPEGSKVITDPNGIPTEVTLPAMVYIGVIAQNQDSATLEFHQLIYNSLKWVTGDYEDPLVDTLIRESICSGDSVIIGDSVFKKTGPYYITLTNQHGTDSTVRLELRVRKSYIDELSVNICSGDSVQIGDTYFNETGEYSMKFINQYGCDSIINLNLQVLTPIEKNISETICDGVFLMFGDSLINNSGVYTDTLTSSLGCDSIVNLTLEVNAKPIINLGNDTIINKNQFVILDAGNQESYLWSTGQTTQVIRIDSQTGLGENVISVLVSSKDGCTNSDTIFVTINNTISGLHTTNTISQIELFPNPTKGILSIENLNRNTIYTIRLIDISGNELIQKQLEMNDNSLDISGLNRGIYLVEILSREGRYIGKVVKD